MGDLLGPSGLLKASLNEPKWQQMLQSIECHVIGEMLSARQVSKPSNFLTSYLLNFFFSLAPLQKLLIKLNIYRLSPIFYVKIICENLCNLW
jgi:hypothetical protein